MQEETSKEINVLSLCDGMGTGKLAFDCLGIPVNYYAVEINESARELADYNLDGIIRPFNDLRDIKYFHILEELPVFDYILFGFTCKSLSVQGKRTNLSGESRIVFDCMKVLWMAKYRNPKLKFLIENVASMENKMKDYLDDLFGLKHVSINSKLVSGQSRERLYWCNWEVSQPKDRGVIVHNELEEDASELKAWSASTRYRDDKTGKIYSSPALGRTPYRESRYRTDDKANTLVTGKGFRGQSTRNIVVTRDGEERDLTVREGARFQTIPDSFDFSVVSDSAATDAIGNGWTLEIIKHILKEGL